MEGKGGTRRGTVTITTVAEVAGVSVATVSRVMNGVTTVDPSLAERVRAVARQLDYRPNAVAQGLARGTLRTLGVVVPDLGNPYFHQILKSIEANARPRDYRVLVADSNDDPGQEIEICQWLAGQVDSLILCSPRMSKEQLLDVKAQAPSVVMTNRREPGVAIPAVYVDSGDVMRALTMHLAELGHRRVVYLRGPDRSWAARDRLAAVLDQTAVEVQPVACGGTIEDGYRALPSALDREPTAILAFNDLVAFGALARMAELGVTVPGDISLTGFDDIPFSRYVGPPLTSVTYPHRQMGASAWELAQLSADDAAARPPVRLTADVIHRDSTGPPSRR